MNFVGIIPARYGSVRFPGKSLAILGNRPVIRWVYEKSALSLDEVFVATDDERIMKTVEDFGGNAVMTDPGHQSGTDRCREAMDSIISTRGMEIDVVINIQGDEPFIRKEEIDLLKECFSEKETEIASLVKIIENTDDIFDENKPKVLMDKNNRALMFSRNPIPFIRGKKKPEWIHHHTFYRHIGIYAYRKEVLREITEMDRSPLEIAESLEQLRWLENGKKIKLAITKHDSIGIDTPADLKKAEIYLRKIQR